VIDLHATNRRVLLLIPLLLVLVGAWFATRWYVGNTVAEYGPSVEEGGLDAARVAVRLAPKDPLTHWRLGRLEEKEFGQGPIDGAARNFAAAVELSPHDYRLWMDFGRALEASGNAVQAEAALRQAVKLAHAYGYPRWYLGNFLLRAGRTDEAFAELRIAAESTQPLRSQIFSLALQVMGDDSEALKKAMGDSPELRAQLTAYLISNQKLDVAIRLWNSFDPQEKKEQHEIGEALIKALANIKRFQAALEVARDLAAQDNAVPVPNQVFNGGFELAAGSSVAGVFAWEITSLPQAQAAIDSGQYHGGGRSLRLVFKSTTTLALNTVAQLIVVEPHTQYRLEYYARTEDLRSAGTPFFQIIDESDGAVLGASTAISAGTTSWQPVIIEFATKAKTEGVRLRINRAACGEDPVCPIFGTVWYDDFNLQRAGRAAGAKPGHDTPAH